jgi:hypothetical protein
MPRSSLGMTVWGIGGKPGIFSTGELNSPDPYQMVSRGRITAIHQASTVP